jgi:cobalt-zinc-cadmium efflux system protein
MDEHAAALDSHVVIEKNAWGGVEDIKRAIKQVLKERFGITHSTLEFERWDVAHMNAHLYGHGRKRPEKEPD